MSKCLNIVTARLLLASAFFLASCGGGGGGGGEDNSSSSASTSTPAPSSEPTTITEVTVDPIEVDTSRSVTVNASGLVHSSISVTLNGLETKTINSLDTNPQITFDTEIEEGDSYNVAITSQPQSPSISCVSQAPSGTAESRRDG